MLYDAALEVTNVYEYFMTNGERLAGFLHTPVVAKLCGLTSEDALRAAVEAGAAFAGLVHYPPSPRHLTLEAGARLRALIPPSVGCVAVTVDLPLPELERLVEAWKPDMIQCHGSETPEMQAAIRARFGVPIIRAIKVRDRAQLETALAHETEADWLLLDAAPPRAGLPGGNALSFDWNLLRGVTFPRPWMLSGGLTPENVAASLRITGATAVDVSSGIESAPGVKDAGKITRFMQALV
jgi:phosphoribosylanthranilate isomerase